MSFTPGLVSICLPVYNGEQYLQGAIQSILAQTYQNLELIIFDDFSSDHSLAIIEYFAGLDNRIHHWRNGRRLGLFETYNQCLGQASGEYIKLFSQGDLLHHEAVEACVGQMQAEPSVALVTIGHELIDARGGPIKNPDQEWMKEAFKPFRPIERLEVLEKCLFPLTNHLGEASAVMFRSALQGTGFDSRLHQYAELDYWLRIIMEGDCICLPEAYAHIRHHLGSAAMTNSRNLMGACDLIKIARKFSRVIEACGESEEEFLDQSIGAYVAEVQSMVADGTIAAGPLRRAEDLRARAAMNSSHETSASATVAFSALASALVGGDVSAVSFAAEPNASGAAMLEDLIDFREFAFHAIRLLSQSALAAAKPVEKAKKAKTGELAKPIAAVDEKADVAIQQQYYDVLQDVAEEQDFTNSEPGLFDDGFIAESFVLPPVTKRGVLPELNTLLGKPLKRLKETTGSPRGNKGKTRVPAQ
jgi:glycosyltransferase involved in cell wall biosynthesis